MPTGRNFRNYYSAADMTQQLAGLQKHLQNKKMFPRKAFFYMQRTSSDLSPSDANLQKAATANLHQVSVHVRVCAPFFEAKTGTVPRRTISKGKRQKGTSRCRQFFPLSARQSKT